MPKVLILSSFHRYVPTGKFRETSKDGRVEIERKETFTKGQTVDASDEDAADWVAKDLAEAANAASTGDAGAEAGSAV